MTGRDLLLDRDIGEQRAVAILLASHQQSCGCLIFTDVAWLFGELLSIKYKCFKIIISRSRDSFLISLCRKQLNTATELA